MPVFCAVLNCGSRGERDKCSFYRFPSIPIRGTDKFKKLKKERRLKWIAAVKRLDLTDTKIKYERICSKHFLSGKPAKIQDVSNPDWVPNQNMGYSMKSTSTSAVERAVKGLKIKNVALSPQPPENVDESMGRSCYVPGCKSLPGSKESTPDGKNLSLFKVPKDPEMLKVWDDAIGRSDRRLSSQDLVCAQHFTNDCFLKEFRTNLPNNKVFILPRDRVQLKKGSVPTIFPVGNYILNKRRRVADPDETKYIETHEAPPFTFDTLNAALSKIKKPSKWWTLNHVANCIVCVRWNEQFNCTRKVIVSEDLKFKVFIDDCEIQYPYDAVADSTSFQVFLSKVEELVPCQLLGCSEDQEYPCKGYWNRINRVNLCSSCYIVQNRYLDVRKATSLEVENRKEEEDKIKLYSEEIWQPGNCNIRFFDDHKTLHRKTREIVTVESALKGKDIILFYFSAQWCLPCRNFTPLLTEFYKDLKQTNDSLEVIFVSSDKSTEALFNYMNESHGDWLAVPHGSVLSRNIRKKFRVSGIPMLVVVKRNGTIITTNGIKDIESKGARAFMDWKR